MKTHINDVSAHAIGNRFAVLDRNSNCIGYHKDMPSADHAARQARGRVVHLTGNKSTDLVTLERNGFKSNPFTKLRQNPVQNFDFPEGYRQPTSTFERVKESYTPGIREVGGLRDSPLAEGTEYESPDVAIPVPQGLSYLPHQIAGITMMIRRKNVFLADEQGLGKTIEIAGYINAINPDKTLIVCPGIAIPNWYDELKLWLVDKTKRILVLDAGKFCRVETVKGEYSDTYKFIPVQNQLKPDFDIVITRYYEFVSRKSQAEAGAKLVESEEPTARRLSNRVRSILKVFENAGLDLLVLDECHVLKNPKAFWTLAMFGESPDLNIENDHPYPGLATFAERKVFASGTPIVNDTPIDLFHMLKSLDKKAWPHIEVFISDFGGEKVKGGKRGRKSKADAAKTAPRNNDMLGIKLRDTVLIRRKADDVLELPPMKVEGFLIKETPEVQLARQLLMDAMHVDNEDDLEAAINSKIDKEEMSEEEAEQELIDISEGGGKGKKKSKKRRSDEDEDEDEDDDDESQEENTGDQEGGVSEGELARTAEILEDESIDPEQKLRLVRALNRANESKEVMIAQGRQSYKLGEMTTARVAMGVAKAMQFKYIYDWTNAQIGPYIKNGKLVIFYIFKKTGDRVEKELMKIGYTEDQIIRIDSKTNNKNGYRGSQVKKFQKDPNIKIFLGTIGTCSSAITLTAANTSIFMELDWCPGIVDQAMKRTHRYAKDNASTKAVYEIFPYAKKSIDANVYNRLTVKKQVQREILDKFPGLKFDEREDKFVYNDNDARLAIHRYETGGFKDKDIPNSRYPLEQRLMIDQAVFQIIKALDEMRLNYSMFEVKEKTGLSDKDIDLFYEFATQAKGPDYDYGAPKRLTTADFDETLIDDVLPLIYKKKNMVTKRSLFSNVDGIIFPESITGTKKGLYRPIGSGHYSVKDTAMGEASSLHKYLYTATFPVRHDLIMELRGDKAEARAQKLAEKEAKALAKMERMADEMGE